MAKTRYRQDVRIPERYRIPWLQVYLVSGHYRLRNAPYLCPDAGEELNGHNYLISGVRVWTITSKKRRRDGNRG